MLTRFFQRIEEKEKDCRQPPVLTVAFGDSATQGCMECDVIAHSSVYHHLLKQMLENAYPKSTFSMLNAGVSGDTAAKSLDRLDRDVIRHDPALVIVGFCLNDSLKKSNGMAEYAASMNTILDRIAAETSADVILLTSNFMATRATGRIHPTHRCFTELMTGCQNDGVVSAYNAEIRKIGETRGLPVADVYARWEYMASEGVDTTALLSNGLNHPDAAGQRLIAEAIWNVISRNAPLADSSNNPICINE